MAICKCTKTRALLGAFLMAAPCFVHAAIDGWSAPLFSYIDMISDDPNKVITSVESSLPTMLDTPEKAAQFAVLCRARNALMQNEIAAQAAQKGLALIREEREPWLFHQLSLCSASAMNNGELQTQAKSLTLPALQWARNNNSHELLVYGLAIDGYLDLSLHDLDNALDNFQEGYRIAQQRKTQLTTGDFASMIALVYEYQGEPELTLPYFKEAESYYRTKPARLSLANTLFGLGRANLVLGNTEEGLAQVRESANLALDVGDLQGAAYSYVELAQHLINQNKIDVADDFLQEALSIFESADNRYMQISVLLSMSEVELQRGNEETSSTLLDRADSLADGDGFIPAQLEINDRKAELLAYVNDYQQAYELMRSNLTLGQKLYQNENSQRLLELKTRFEVDQQKIKNALLQEQNLRQKSQLETKQVVQRYGIAVGFLLLLVIALLGYLYINGRRHRERLEKLANQDHLTGLMSRRNIMERLEHQLALAKRINAPLSVAVVDLDHFKQINDNFGHAMGDAVLREFGKLATQCFRVSDGLGRVGGEEFLFYFPHTESSQAKQLLERFAMQVHGIPKLVGSDEIKVSLSAGLAVATNSDEIRTVIARADKALYQAKENGRDRIELA